MRRLRRLVVAGPALGLALGLALGSALLAAPATAVPSGGPSPDTPGTSATVSPRSLQAGGTVSYRITGFPGGEIVYIKIDDGRFCSQSGVHGACVVQQQRIPASGTVTGSLVLPSDLSTGRHWLRFLASKEMYAADGAYEGVKGFTLRGNSDFTVTAGSTSPGTTNDGSTATSEPGAVATTAPPGTTAGTAPAPTASSAAPTTSADTTTVESGDGAAAAGATLEVAPSAAPTSSAGADDGASSEEAQPEDTTAEPVAADTSGADSAADSFPVVGVVGLAVMCLLAGMLLGRWRRTRA